MWDEKYDESLYRSLDAAGYTLYQILSDKQNIQHIADAL